MKYINIYISKNQDCDYPPFSKFALNIPETKVLVVNSQNYRQYGLLKSQLNVIFDIKTIVIKNTVRYLF